MVSNKNPITMNSYTSNPFLRLPDDIRDRIYLLATPPRIVRVEESPQVSSPAVLAFLYKLQFTGKRPFIHPSLAYFSPFWRPYVLELQGWNPQILPPHEPISLSPTQPDPWKPSQSCPRIDPVWLAHRPELAWNLCRSSSVYSKAPIPPLLHTCRDSRNRLRRLGYELAFSTRTCEARTWFNFRRDTLFLRDPDIVDFQRYKIDVEGRYFDDMLLALPFNLAQFMPLDLLSVRRLALPFDRVLDMTEPSSPDLLIKIMGALRVIPHLEQLFIANGIFGPGAETQPLEWIDCDASDYHIEEVRRFSLFRDLSKFVIGSSLFKPYTDAWADFSTCVGNEFEERLQEGRDEDLRHSVRKWGVPKVKVGYLGAPRDLRRLSRIRQEYWQDVGEKSSSEKEQSMSSTYSESGELTSSSSGGDTWSDDWPMY
ncbi:2EXR domain-containing protein [Fusarium sp. LHS14.1]|nr:2EXR domain-containing protein [Fusarium sp. LHS14.1]